ncbi:MAG TPA: HAMP domain-containing protein [Anaerolineales bacterium]|nr:HAMP domain-containing protein [Anaerolineales bacterium]
MDGGPTLKTRVAPESDSGATPRFASSLRARVALGVALPLLLALSAFSYGNYLRAVRIMDSQLRSTASQLGAVMTGGLRQAMLANDRELLAGALADIAGMEAIDRVRVVDENTIVRFDTEGTEVGAERSLEGPGCIECHAVAAPERSRAVLLTSPEGTLRIATPIENEAACEGCHAPTSSHLGVLLADVPLQALEAGLLKDLTFDLAISVAVSAGVSLAVYLLVHWLIVRRLEAMQAPLATYAQGDFAVRLPVEASPDEIGRLSNAVNTMAEQLERTAQLERQQRALREEATYEERERIARELHDGLAQILGYVNTKAMAVRLLLQNQQAHAALRHLEQLEEAAREVLVDVRQAILGLRLTSRPGESLAARMRIFAGQFSRLSGLPVAVDLPAEDTDLGLNPETEVELLRIVQEALTNIRKHADARHAQVRLRLLEDGLELTVTDDGDGFDPSHGTVDRNGHFGLESMEARARSIGADFDVHSHPGAGTQISVRWKSREE